MSRRGPGPDHSDGPMAFVEALDEPELTEDDRHHLGRVLRVRPDDPMVLCDGRGAWRSARFGDPVQLAGPVQHVDPPPWPITVAFALPKGDRPELVVQKLTELGVDRIVPLLAERSVVRWDPAKADKQRSRWRRVAREAAMQCRRTWLPMIEPLAHAADFVAAESDGGAAVAMAERGGVGLDAWVASAPSSASRVVAVGPEGGWTADELAAAPATVRVGDHVLRVETAAIACAAILTAERARPRAGS